MPQRSYLYSLQAMGVGTLLVESLTSYTARLVAEHQIAIKTLFVRELAEFTQNGSTEQNHCRLSASLASVIPLNGTTTNALKLVQSLQTLTLRDDLQFLTMLTWKEVLTPAKLLRRYEAWCPYCYEAWRKMEQAIYKPLIWQIDAVTVCPHHHQRLHFQCPYCHQQNLSFIRCLQPGHCSVCKQWLGLSLDTKTSDCYLASKEDLNQWIWAANSIGNLVADAANLPLPPQRNKVAQVISACIDNIAAGNSSAFARMLNLPYYPLQSWQAGKFLPPLAMLLQICYRLEVSLLDFLTKKTLNLADDVVVRLIQSQPLIKGIDRKKQFTSAQVIPIMQLALQESPPPSLQEVVKRFGYQSISSLRWHSADLSKAISKRHTNYIKTKYWETLKGGIEAAIISDENPPPSVKDVANRLRCHTSTLYDHFLDECYTIAARYISYQKARSRQNLKLLCQKVRETVLRLNSEGIYPTARRVSIVINKPAFMKIREVRATFHEVRREIGIEVKDE